MPKKTKPKKESVDHGIDGGVYSSDGISFHPILFCLCQWRTDISNMSWEEAGSELDEHLRENVVDDEF